MRSKHNHTGSSADTNAANGNDAAALVAARLAKLEVVRGRMRQVNSLARSSNATDLKRSGIGGGKVSRLLNADGQRRAAFASLVNLRNNLLHIAALRRLARELDAAGPDGGDDGPAFSYVEDQDAQQIRFRFAAKPDKATRALLRRARFELRPARKAYERVLDADGLLAAAWLRVQLKRLER